MAGAVQAQTNFRVGLAEDPDVLDPTLARTFVGRIVFSALCDKLIDIDEKLDHGAAAGHQLGLVGRQQGADDEDPPGRHVPRWREARRGGGQVQPRAPQDDAGLQPARRAGAAGQRGRGRPDDGQAQPERAVLAAAGRAGRSRRDDGVAEGRAGRRRQLRRQAGLLGAVQVRGARGAGPHRARALRRLLEQGQHPLRQDHLHADRRRHRAAGQPQVGPVRLHRARGVERHREAAGREEVQGHAHHRDRLPGHHDQRGQERAGQEHRARQGPARARGLRAGHRSPGPGPGGDGQRGHRGQPVGRAEQQLLRQEHAAAQA